MVNFLDSNKRPRDIQAADDGATNASPVALGIAALVDDTGQPNDGQWIGITCDTTGAIKVNLGGATIDATISSVGQGNGNNDATQPWIVRLSNGSGFLGVAAAPLYAAAMAYDGAGNANDATHPIIVGPSTAAKAATGATAARLTFDGSAFLSLGQALAAASIPVVVPVAQDVVAYAGSGNAIKVADGGGSLTVDSPGIPTALGQALAAASMPIVLPVAQDIVAKASAAAGASAPANVVQSGGPDGSGNLRGTRLNSSGAAHSVPAPGTSICSTALEASRVLSASPCSLNEIRMANTNVANRYVQVHNATSLPSNGSIPSDVASAGAAGTGTVSHTIPCDRYTVGAVACTSSTLGTLTIGSADALFQAILFPATA